MRFFQIYEMKELKLKAVEIETLENMNERMIIAGK